MQRLPCFSLKQVQIDIVFVSILLVSLDTKLMSIKTISLITIVRHQRK